VALPLPQHQTGSKTGSSGSPERPRRQHRSRRQAHPQRRPRPMANRTRRIRSVSGLGTTVSLW
jgi:hypothetical protein